MTTPGTVALVDDDDDLRAATAQLLSLSGHDVRQFPAAAPALAAIGRDFPGVVVTDVRMPGMSGLELLRVLAARDPELPVVLMTGHGDVDMAVSALKTGAWDFLTKPFQPDALLAAVGRAMTARALTMENRQLRALAEASAADELVGHSAAIRQLRATVPVLADAALDVVVEGATGTGKQLLARLIHRAGRRSRHRFAVVNCAALPAGAEEGLFDAHGMLAGAHRGTLFLDNLDRASERLQHWLAQFAEQRAVALDKRDPVPIDTRIIAALDEGARGQVLPALFHRLAAVSLRLPPLAERMEDIPLLVLHFLENGQGGRAHPAPLGDLAHLVERRIWPGNVRELEMAVERFVLGLDDAAPGQVERPLPDRVRAFERALIVDAVTRARGDASRATELLGIPRETFYYRVKRLGIDLRQLRGAGDRPTPEGLR